MAMPGSQVCRLSGNVRGWEFEFQMSKLNQTKAKDNDSCGKCGCDKGGKEVRIAAGAKEGRPC